jgi:hypothetical protein
MLMYKCKQQCCRYAVYVTNTLDATSALANGPGAACCDIPCDIPLTLPLVLSPIA